MSTINAGQEVEQILQDHPNGPDAEAAGELHELAQELLEQGDVETAMEVEVLAEMADAVVQDENRPYPDGIAF